MKTILFLAGPCPSAAEGAAVWPGAPQHHPVDYEVPVRHSSGVRYRVGYMVLRHRHLLNGRSDAAVSC